MLQIHIEAPGELRRTLDVPRLPCIIGRQGQLDLQMRGWRVAREHACLEREDGQFFVRDLGSLAGTFVNGARILRYGPLLEGDLIRIGAYELQLDSRGMSTPTWSTPALEGEGAGAGLKAQGPDLSSRDEQAGAPDHAAPLAALMRQWQQRLHGELLATLDLRRHDIQSLEADALEQLVRTSLSRLIEGHDELPQALDRGNLLDAVCHEAIGLGPLESLLADPDVSEIMVNGTDPIFVERGGRLMQERSRFSSAEAVHAVIERIVAPLGRRIDDASPMVDARLADGSRVNAVIPPLSVHGPCLTIRRFNRRMLEPADLLRLACASSAMIDFLCESVRSRLNIVVSGGTGSGKTTLLNILSAMIGVDERVVTIEDAAELRLHHRNLVSLEARPVNVEGRGLVQIRDLVRNALRMRPDRIVVGECRGAEALDMLQAMNTGHDGSLTTVHANSPRDVIARLETMTLMSGFDLPVQAIREQMASAIDLIVHQARGPDGRRRIVEIVEVTGMEGHAILMQTLFKYRRAPAHDPGAGFQATGDLPHFLSRLDDPSRFPLSWFGVQA